jgi:hypothetical protein
VSLKLPVDRVGGLCANGITEDGEGFIRAISASGMCKSIILHIFIKIPVFMCIIVIDRRHCLYE